MLLKASITIYNQFMSKSLVSIIITTKNEELVIGRLLESIKKQEYKYIEIIVVDNNSTDKTKKISQKYTKKFFNKGPERSAQRNYGVNKAKGEYILILDADMELKKDLVAKCVKKISNDKKLGGVVIPEVSVAVNFWEEVKAFERSFYNKNGDSSVDAARFFKKKVFTKVNGYDETITGPEDWDLPERIKKEGYKISRVNTQIYHHEKIDNPIKLAQKKYYYALTSHRYLKKHNISPISPKTIYFLRPVFYKQPLRLVKNPILTIAMFIMFTFELIGGGLGFMTGKIKNL